MFNSVETDICRMNKFIVLALVICAVASMVNGDLNDDKVELNARLRRGVWHGAFKTNSNKETKYHKKVFTHKMSTNPEGGVSIDTKHHHEKGGSSENSNNSGRFAFGKNNQLGHGQGLGNGGWFDDE